MRTIRNPFTSLASVSLVAGSLLTLACGPEIEDGPLEAKGNSPRSEEPVVRRFRPADMSAVRAEIMNSAPGAQTAKSTSTTIVTCTCDASDAGTDGNINAYLYSSAWGQSGPFYLDHGGVDDHERGWCYSYTFANGPDSMPEEFYLQKSGGSYWCVSLVEVWQGDGKNHWTAGSYTSGAWLGSPASYGWQSMQGCSSVVWPSFSPNAGSSECFGPSAGSGPF